MLSHEDYYNMKYILKDKKITLKYISGTWVHWFFDINEHREEIIELPWEYLDNRLEKRLKSLPGEEIIDIPHRMMYNCNRWKEM